LRSGGTPKRGKEIVRSAFAGLFGGTETAENESSRPNRAGNAASLTPRHRFTDSPARASKESGVASWRRVEGEAADAAAAIKAGIEKYNVDPQRQYRVMTRPIAC
jgi:hypothetical protein